MLSVAVQEMQQSQIWVYLAVFEVDGVVFVGVVVEVDGVKFLCPVVVLRSVNLEVDRVTHHSNLALVTLCAHVVLAAHETRQVRSETVAPFFDVQNGFELYRKDTADRFQYCLSVILLKQL